MPKRSRSRTRKRTRQSGGKDHDNDPNINEEEKKEEQSMVKDGVVHDNTGHKDPVISGGKRGKTSRKGKKRMKKSRKGKKMNEFFKLLIKAKKSGAPSFVYKGNTYKKKVGTKKNPKLIIYKKA
jgi:hypothetical protein